LSYLERLNWVFKDVLLLIVEIGGKTLFDNHSSLLLSSREIPYLSKVKTSLFSGKEVLFSLQGVVFLAIDHSPLNTYLPFYYSVLTFFLGNDLLP